MGLSDLRDLAVIDQVESKDITGATVAVDFNNWLYRYLTILVKFTDEEVYTTKNGIEVANLLGIIKGVPKFIELDLLPVFVFDGEILELKEAEIAQRRERRETAENAAKAAEQAGDTERAAQLRARSQRLTPKMLDTSREFLHRLDLPVVDAPAEAEAQAAHITIQGDAEYVVSEDYDTLQFGAPLTLRELTSKGSPEIMRLQETLARHGITRDELVDIAILCGTDYNEGVHGIGPKTALDYITAGDSVESVLETRSATINDLEAIRSIYLSPDIDETYSYSETCSPDIDAITDYLTEWEIPTDSFNTALNRLQVALNDYQSS